jgi:hypothetical protein
MVLSFRAEVAMGIDQMSEFAKRPVTPVPDQG